MVMTQMKESFGKRSKDGDERKMRVFTNAGKYGLYA